MSPLLNRNYFSLFVQAAIYFTHCPSSCSVKTPAHDSISSSEDFSLSSIQHRGLACMGRAWQILSYVHDVDSFRARFNSFTLRPSSSLMLSNKGPRNRG